MFDRGAPPQPIPYQGSKRRLVPQILSFLPPDIETLWEPFVGSGAVTLGAANGGWARNLILGDTLDPLVGIWLLILNDPRRLVESYTTLWTRGMTHPDAYERIRQEHNASPDPARLLYLIARCVKNAVRFNASGEFNQSADRRRLGMRPETLKNRVEAAHRLLAGRTDARVADYAESLREAGPRDVIYMDPPYLGVSRSRDPRYHQGLDYDRFLGELDKANGRELRYLVSLDGHTGARDYGPPLPAELGLRRLELAAGRSSQATLLGRVEQTVEALYLSPALSQALSRR